METAADRAGWYGARAADHRARRVAEARLVGRLAAWRLIAFAVAVALAARWATIGTGRRPWLAAAALAAGAFLWLVQWSRTAKARLTHTDDLIGLAEAGAHRVSREWAHLPPDGWVPEPASHPYAGDLDLFGDASLVQLLPPVTDAPGRTTVRAWLTAPATVEDIRRRQEAVAELRERYEFRDELAIVARRSGATADAAAQVAAWAAGSPAFTSGPTTVALSVAVPVLTIALLFGQLAGALQDPFWIAPLAAGLLILGRYRRRLVAEFAPVVSHTHALRRYASLARLVTAQQFAGPMLVAVQQRLDGPPRSAERAIRALSALADSTELHQSPMLYLVVNALTLWDMHVAALLERWRRRDGHRVGEWLAALGDVEALSALATLAFDNPDWSVPDVEARDDGTIHADALGHPLLAPAVGVRNDVSVGPGGTILVVTGSNMAGKSTLLRAIGLNLVLSQAGSVVCARRFSHPPVAVYTSMRIQDSLERGVSYFMAELQRLKTIVDAADAAAGERVRTVVYLLDEMLHGTNSAERTIAARRVLGHLARSGAIGAVTTHDLHLVDAPELARLARHVHFSEQFVRTNGVTAMSFDYRLRAGKATSTNALALLEMVGLGREEGGAEPSP